MKYCTKCGKELVDEAVICPVCGCACSPDFYNAHKEADQVSIGLCILAFFIPIFGLIFWAIKRQETPKNANAIGLTALISWGINFISTIIMSVFFADIFQAMLNTLVL